MSEVAAIIMAIVAALGSLGAAFKFVWDKIEARFDAMQEQLDHCNVRDIENRDRRAVQLSVIELLWQEVLRHAPDSPVLARAKSLLEDLKRENNRDGT